MWHFAKELCYEYVGVTDHSPSLKIAHDDLNGRLNGFRVLKSAEVDIPVDGTLDLPYEVLCELDYTVCSIHYRFAQQRSSNRASLACEIIAISPSWITLLVVGC